MEQESGVKHLLGAISLNTRRGMTYAKQTRGRSLLVSIPLILSEMMSLLSLGLFDLWGARFNREGINIIAGDYVPMAKAKALGSPLRFNGVASSEDHNELGRRIKDFVSKGLAANSNGSLNEIVELTYEMIQYVLQLEAKTKSLFAMHRHILESVGIAALHAMDYLKQSNGRTATLTRWFLTLQLYAVLGSAYFDRAAQQCHACNAGIIENDVPYIPFLEAYAEKKSQVDAA